MLSFDELDRLAAKYIFKWDCVHEVEYIPEDVLIEFEKEEFRKEYGQEPPASYVGNTFIDMNSDYPPKWCKHCHSRSGDIFKKPLQVSRSAQAVHAMEKQISDDYICGDYINDLLYIYCSEGDSLTVDVTLETLWKISTLLPYQKTIAALTVYGCPANLILTLVGDTEEKFLRIPDGK